MTHTFTLWLGRLFSSAGYPSSVSALPARKPMKIEVQSLPDYLWRELGFPPARRAEEEPPRR